jgi:ABC-type glycerol-3-phosphate transport system substrate-binding protein
MAASEGVPARLSVMDATKYPAIKEANPNLEPFRKMITETGFAQPKWVKLSDAYFSMITALQKCILQQATPEQALADAQKEVEALLA